MSEADGKPTLHLLPAELPTAEDLAALYTALTGKAATPEELAQMEADLVRIAEKYQAFAAGEPAPPEPNGDA
jgi:hypothetical protein